MCNTRQRSKVYYQKLLLTTLTTKAWDSYSLGSSSTRWNSNLRQLNKKGGWTDPPQVRTLEAEDLKVGITTSNP